MSPRPRLSRIRLRSGASLSQIIVPSPVSNLKGFAKAALLARWWCPHTAIRSARTLGFAWRLPPPIRRP